MSPNKTLSRNHVTTVESSAQVVPLSMFSDVSSDLQNKTSCSYTVSAVCMNPRCLLSTFVLHQRLGYPSSKILDHVIKNFPALKAINGSKSFESCDACMMGKLHRLYFPVSFIKTSNPLELLHTNLWGPTPKLSLQGYRYYVSFVNDFTRLTWIFPLKTKVKLSLSSKSSKLILKNS